MPAKVALSRRMADVCSWVCLAATVVAWVLAFRIFRDAQLGAIASVLIAVRVFAVFLVGDRLSARISLYADRVAWNAIVLVPLFTGDVTVLLVAVGLWIVWGVAAGLGRYWYALSATEDERARAEELAAL